MADWSEVGSLGTSLVVMEAPSGWIEVESFGVSLLTAEAPPPPCETDADCPEGYICKNGQCVKGKVVPSWAFIAGGTGIGMTGGYFSRTGAAGILLGGAFGAGLGYVGHKIYSQL